MARTVDCASVRSDSSGLVVVWLLVLEITYACGGGSVSTEQAATFVVPSTSGPIVTVRDTSSTSALPEAVTIGLNLVVGGLDAPVAAAVVPGTSRVLVAERAGRVRVVDEWVLSDLVALDISLSTVSEGSEQGLVGIAPHPDFARTGRVYISSRRGRAPI